VHHWLGLICIQFQNIQEIVVPVVGDGAHPVPALNSRTQHIRFDPRRIEKQVFVYVQRGIRLGSPGLYFTRCYLYEVCRIIENELCIEAGVPPPAILRVTFTFC